MKQQLRMVPELRQDTIPKARQVLRLLALFHDIGHPPFSHSGEVIAGKHEKASVDTAKRIFGRKLDRFFFPGCCRLVCELLSGNVGNRNLSVLQRFISGEMDMDRVDYLIRDSLHCGVEYGRFDYARLIESLNLTRNDVGMIDLCVEEGGFHTVEALLLARYQMNLQVYYHAVRRIYDHYLGEFLKGWAKLDRIDIQAFRRMDDSEVWEAIRRHATLRKKKEPTGLWARRLLERKHHRVVFKSGEHADFDHVSRARRLFSRLRTRYSQWDFFLDDSANGKVHNLPVRGDSADKVERIDDILVLDRKTGICQSIGLGSAIIGKIPKEFSVLRIFAWPPGGDIKRKTVEAQLKKIRRWCKVNF